MPRVAVVGAGWAGLAAAVELADGGAEVTLLEAAPEPGGRARRLAGADLDNGQHLLLGAYRHTLALMARVGADPARLLLRLPLELRVLTEAGPVHLKARGLPAPLHLAHALATCHGLSAGERLAALGLALRSWLAGFGCDDNLTVERWLAGQPRRVRDTLWEPLCLAALNTPPAQASAAVFLRVLKEAFAHRRADSDLLVPAADLGALLPRPAAAYLARRGARLLGGRRVTALTGEGATVTGVTTREEIVAADHVVVATAHHAAARLLQTLPEHPGPVPHLADLGHQPICTVYLQYPEDTALELPLVGLAGGLGQWLFDGRVAGHPGRMAVVVSAAGAHMDRGRDALAAAVAEELAGHFPHWPAPRGHRVIRERHATFDCRAGVQARRPGNRTPVAGLWLAGDYTDTPFPATLEGAVMSGLQCARLILEDG